MCDQQQKVKNKRTDAKSQEMKHHPTKLTHHHLHRHQQKFHQSDDDNQDTHSTAEDSLLSDHLPHHHHSRRYYRKQSHGKRSLSETSFTSSHGSSSSTYSSSTTTTTSSSCSSSSNSSSTSASSTSLSSENSSEGSDRFLLRRPQHSQSCSNISEKHKYADGEDTAPLIDTRGHDDKQKQSKGKSFQNGTQMKTHENSSFRKSKSMEALTCPSEKEGQANDEEQERRKNEVRKSVMKEKTKFSAFLNEITRQVLSPMRLTTLGVTDAQKPNSTETRKSENDTGRSQQRSRPVSADSVASSQYSHTQHSKSNSSHRHRSHRSPDSPNHMEAKPRSCTDISCLETHPSWSPSSRHCSPYRKQDRRRNQGDHIQPCRHHSLSSHRYPRNKSPHHHRRCYSPVFYRTHEDCDSSSSHGNHYEVNHDRGRCRNLTHPHRMDYHDLAVHQQGDHHFHYPRGYYNHGHVPRHGGQHSSTYPHEEHRNKNLDHDQFCNSSSQHYQDHPSKGHHHNNHLNMKRPMTPRHGNQAQSTKPYSKHHHEDHHRLDQHHSLKDQHHQGVPHNDHPNRQHGDRHSGIQQHNHKVHGDGGHRPYQRAQPSELDLHHRPGRHHGGHHSPKRQHHHGYDHKEAHQPDNEDSQNCHPEHRYGSHHSPNRPNDHGDKHSPNQEEHHNKTHQHPHGEHQSAGHQHKDHHSPNGQHHKRDHTSSHHQHHHGEHKSPNSPHQHEVHHRHIHQNHHGNPSHPEPHPNKHLSRNETEHEDRNNHSNRESAPSLPPHQKKTVLSCKMDSTRKMNSLSGRDEEQTDFTGPSISQEPKQGMEKITILQEENDGLQQSSYKSAVKMECFGEFLNSHKLLEEELQRTRVELNNLTESFKILHENCSSTQQTNSLLEQKLNSVTQSMEGERERLSRRISALTEQLAGAKFANNMDTFNVNSVLSKTKDYFHLDDAFSQVMLPLAPPPVQFMDSQNYEKVKVTGQEQCLGSVPEEEESDWSEMGEEIPRFLLAGSNRSPAWMHTEGDMDKDSESGGEEILRLPSPRPLQIPHLQFTIHNELLPGQPANACPSGMTGENAFRLTASPNLGSTILIRSASLEEIPLACSQMPKELRGTEAMMDLHHRADETSDDLDNEIIHHWRTNRDGRASEADSAPCSLQSVEQMLNQFMREPQPGEGIRQSRSEMHGWTGGMAKEVLGGEQTQL